MKIAQALGSGKRPVAYRVIDKQRILVERETNQLRVVVQRRVGQCWLLSDALEGVRYLNGVFKDSDGSWIVAGCDLALLSCIGDCLPAKYQHLLTVSSDDWCILL